MNREQGLIRTVLLIIVVIFVLSYFGFNIKEFVESEPVRENFYYVTSFVQKVWDTYLHEPALYLWQNIFIGIVWDAFLTNMDLLRQGQPPINFNVTP